MQRRRHSHSLILFAWTYSDNRQHRDTRSFATLFVATPRPLSKYRRDRTLNTLVEDTLQAPYFITLDLTNVGLTQSTA